jgi:hypothetical protein
MNAGSPARFWWLGHCKAYSAEMDNRPVEMPGLRPYDRRLEEWIGHAQAMDGYSGRDRHGNCREWLHQMRSDLGRLDAIAEILQVGSALEKMQGACG